MSTPTDTEVADKLPHRLCCGKQHLGPVCPDGLVMCCICFERVTLDELNINKDGNKEDVCKSCAATLREAITKAMEMER